MGIHCTGSRSLSSRSGRAENVFFAFLKFGIRNSIAVFKLSASMRYESFKRRVFLIFFDPNDELIEHKVFMRVNQRLVLSNLKFRVFFGAVVEYC